MSELIKLSLPELLRRAWQLLEHAAASDDAPMRTPVAATVDADHGVAARTVILRRADPTRCALMFHTDRRSRKHLSTREDERIELVFYDPGKRLQLRARAAAKLHELDELARQEWDRLSVHARLMYACERFESAQPHFPMVLPKIDGDPFENFAVVVCEVSAIDCLVLHRDCNRRALFERDGDVWSGRWIAP